jgi:hypothetical protein
LTAPPRRDRDFLDAASRALSAPEKRYGSDPVSWARDVLGSVLWARQRAVVESVRDNPRTAVPSCHSTGKSHTAAVAICWWLSTNPPGDAFVLTTAPTGAQVKGILWRYIGRMHKKGRLPGRVNLTEWYIDGELVGLGRKPSDHDPTNLSGYHAPRFLIVIDEACGVTRAIWDALSTLIAGGAHVRVLAIGNPDTSVSEFHDVCQPGSGWNVIQIGYKDTPAWTGEDVPQNVLDSLISPEWVADREARWGRDSALFQAKCEGLFPRQGSPFAVVPHDMAMACRWLELPEGLPHQAGIDVGAGGDRTIVRERRGPVAGRVVEFTDSDPMRTVGRLLETLRAWGVRKVKVDSNGIGWGIYGSLKEHLWPEGVEVVPVNFGAGPLPGYRERFRNLRAQVWWDIGRENCRLQRWDLSAVDDDVINELTAPTYKILDAKGMIQIEPKATVIDRLGFSPDQADALLLAFWDPASVMTVPNAWPNLMQTDLLRGIR